MTAFTRMPELPSSSAATWASIDAPAFAATVPRVMPRPACTALRLVVITIEPPDRISGTQCLMVRNGPTRHTSTTARHCSRSASVISVLVPMPALANATSRRPNRSTAVIAMRSTSDSAVTSHSTVATASSQLGVEAVETRAVDVTDDDPGPLAHEALDRGASRSPTCPR